MASQLSSRGYRYTTASEYYEPREAAPRERRTVPARFVPPAVTAPPLAGSPFAGERRALPERGLDAVRERARLSLQERNMPCRSPEGPKFPARRPTRAVPGLRLPSTTLPRTPEGEAAFLWGSPRGPLSPKPPGIRSPPKWWEIQRGDAPAQAPPGVRTVEPPGQSVHSVAPAPVAAQPPGAASGQISHPEEPPADAPAASPGETYDWKWEHEQIAATLPPGVSLGGEKFTPPIWGPGPPSAAARSGRGGGLRGRSQRKLVGGVGLAALGVPKPTPWWETAEGIAQQVC